MYVKWTDPIKAGVVSPGNTKGGSITVPLTSCLTGLDMYVLQIKTKNVSCHPADSKPVKQEVNGTVILPPLVFPGKSFPLDKTNTLDYYRSGLFYNTGPWRRGCGLYYKHVTIVNYASSGINKLRASLNDNAIVVIYDRHMFIVQTTGLEPLTLVSWGECSAIALPLARKAKT
jgi:hypothetical protein